MKTGLSLALTVLSLSNPAIADTLFEECPKVIETKAYRPLRDFLAEKAEFTRYCQRLNNREFLYADSWDIFYCNFDNAEKPCDEADRGHRRPGAEIRTRFAGPNEKRFVLFEVGRFSGGVLWSDFLVFSLAPKTEYPHGYKIQQLEGAGLYTGAYSDSREPCFGLEVNDQAVDFANGKKSIAVTNEGKDSVSIRFEQTVTSCDTMKRSTRTLEYTLSNGRFERSGSH
jgi:hypothetical protein